MLRKRKTKLVMYPLILGAAALLGLLLLVVNRNYVFQEGNPIPVARGIYEVSALDRGYAVIHDDPVTYLTRTDDYVDLFALIENRYDVDFQGETEGEYVFEGDGKQIVLEARQYTKRYRVWNFSAEANGDED